MTSFTDHLLVVRKSLMVTCVISYVKRFKKALKWALTKSFVKINRCSYFEAGISNLKAQKFKFARG